ncbi:hypothetical protein [Streptacidiphilus carbonis]|nr:hypothetical protein [Streptacidiphilus carbonis]
MTDPLLQDLWFHRAGTVVLDAVAISDHHVTVQATDRRRPAIQSRRR